MQRPSSSSRNSSFDGPGARPILVEAGPSKLRETSSSTSTSEHRSPPVEMKKQGAKSTTPSLTSSTAHSHSPDPSGPSTSSRKPGGKANVSSACGPCKRAHLACDVARPCKRCVNMGKEELCEDVPHKKRGRPKNQQPNIGPPFPLIRRSSAEAIGSSWRGPYEPIYSSYPLQNISSPRAAKVEPESLPPATFTLFTSTDLNILRATKMAYPLSGWYPNEMINQNVRAYVHPEDIHLLDVEVNRLLHLDWLPRPLSSRRDVHSAIPHRSEIDLLSPADGMNNIYPNQNVRILHADRTFTPYNVRFHVGGAFGANLWNPDTIGSVYLVVSFLPLGIPREGVPPPPAPPSLHSFPSGGSSSSTRSTTVKSAPPPTLPPIVSQSLPPFSSIHSPSLPPYPRPPPPLVQDRPYSRPSPTGSRPSTQSYSQPRTSLDPSRRRSPSPMHRSRSDSSYPEYANANASSSSNFDSNPNSYMPSPSHPLPRAQQTLSHQHAHQYQTPQLPHANSYPQHHLQSSSSHSATYPAQTRLSPLNAHAHIRTDLDSNPPDLAPRRPEEEHLQQQSDSRRNRPSSAADTRRAWEL